MLTRSEVGSLGIARAGTKLGRTKDRLEVSETPWTCQCVLILSCPGSTAVVAQCRDEDGKSVVGHGRRLRRNLVSAMPLPKVIALPTILPSPIAGRHHRWAACTLLRREPARHRDFVRELERRWSGQWPMLMVEGITSLARL